MPKKSRRATRKQSKKQNRKSRKWCRKLSRKLSRKQSRKQNGGGEYDEYCEICQLPLYSPGNMIELYEDDNYGTEPVKAILSVDTEWLGKLIGEDEDEAREGMTYDLINYGGSGACDFAPVQSNPGAQAIIDGSKGYIVGYPTREVKKFYVTNQSGLRNNNNNNNNARYMLQGTVYHKDCYNDKSGKAAKKAHKAIEFQDQFYDWANAYRTHGEELFESPLA
jgi:hypothetical protein